MASPVAALLLQQLAARPKAIVGPPAPKEYEPTPLVGDDPSSPSGTKLTDMLPLLLSQGADLISTEGQRTHGAVPGEMNPLPGMSATGGRIGWGLAEALLAHLLTKSNPALRSKMLQVLPAVHSTLAVQNQAQTNSLLGETGPR